MMLLLAVVVLISCINPATAMQQQVNEKPPVDDIMKMFKVLEEKLIISQERIHHLEQLEVDNKLEIKNLKEKMEQMMTGNKECCNHGQVNGNYTEENKNEHQNTDSTSQNIGNEMKRRQLSSFTYFTAYATEDREYNQGDHVEFPGVVESSGPDYKPEISTYICPYDGYYLMAVTVRSLPDHYMLAQIMVENTPLVRAVGDIDSDDQASNLVVSKCDAGQSVWVQCQHDNNKMLGSLESTFTVSMLMRL